MWEKSSDLEVVLTVRGWMKKIQTKNKTKQRETNFKKKAKQGEE
jgi:hypothetical protein